MKLELYMEIKAVAVEALLKCLAGIGIGYQNLMMQQVKVEKVNISGRIL